MEEREVDTNLQKGSDPDIVVRVMAAKEDTLAADDIIRDYIPFIRAQASKATGQIINEGQDEMSIAMIAFHDAIQSYSKIRGSFLNYASVVIKRKLIDFFRKEKRHQGQISLDTPAYDDNEDITLIDRLQEKSDPYTEMSSRDATNEEIMELSAQIHEFGVNLTDVAENSPKQERTLQMCQQALAFARNNPEIIDELKRSKRLPVAKIVAGTGINRKTIERHRRYILVLLLIYSNGYEIIRGHLRQVLGNTKGGTIQ